MQKLLRRRSSSSVALIGPGRLGQALGKRLLDAGISIRFVAARQPESAKRAVRFMGGGKAVSLGSRWLAEADIVLLTTSDAALKPVAERIAAYRGDWSKRVVLHTCGSLPAAVLAPFKRCGGSIGSLHPYQTVPNPAAGVRNLAGGFWAIEGDPEARRVARGWVKLLEGTAFEIAPDAKPLYHLSAFLVCPTVVTLMGCSLKLLRQAGVPNRVIRPMLGQFVRETAKNFAAYGPRKSLTGPVARGDWETLGRHLIDLSRSAPEVVPAYRELVRLMMKLAAAEHSGK